MTRHKIRLAALVTGLTTFWALYVFFFNNREPHFHPFQVAQELEKIVVQTECSLGPLSILSLPFERAIVSELTLQAPAGREVPECRPRTPLFIGFYGDEPLLAQAVLSYIASGWPGVDIVVVDNTASFDTDTKNGSLLDHDRFRQQYGVNILQTPTQLSFSQLQNFYIYTARLQGWKYFFWSHMDIVVLSYQYPSASLYQRVVSSLKNLTADDSTSQWAFGWYRYDYLSLVIVLAASLTGQWDIDIPYYYSDCDYYGRSRLQGFQMTDFKVGHIIDVGSVLPSVYEKLFNSSYDAVYEELQNLEKQKKYKRRTENFWQEWKVGRQIIATAGKQDIRASGEQRIAICGSVHPKSR